MPCLTPSDRVLSYGGDGMSRPTSFDRVCCPKAVMSCHARCLSTVCAALRRLWHAIINFGQHTQWKDVGRGLTSPPLDSTHGRTTSGVTCRHGPWTPHTVEQSRMLHAIIALERQTRLNDVRRGMPSSPLDLLTHSDDIGCGMPSLPLDGKHGRTT